MERYIQGQQLEQANMVPFCLDDFLEEENRLRFIRDFVDRLD